jgi:T4 RnlA family RNA ligase
MKILKYSQFSDKKLLEEVSSKLKGRNLFPEKTMHAKKYLESITIPETTYLPSYEDCLEMCSKEDSPFYESKMQLDGFNISVFNYRLAQYKDFVTPLPNKPQVKAYEMRGLTFIFNNDGSLYKRYILLEKFFNLNQVPESMYSIVKNYKIKFVNEKEDGSIASFIKLPNGKIYGKSKMSFENDQAIGITNIYKSNKDVNGFVNWCMNNDITPIFEYVAPHNRIVLRYSKEELILLRLRDNKTGKHIDIKDHLDKLGSIKIAPFKDDFKDLDSLIELTATEIDKEGYVIQAEDENGKDFFFKLKTPWYCERHGLLTEDLYKENIIIGYILDDKIDDILGQIPEEEVEARERILKIVDIIKRSISKKIHSIDELYKKFVEMGKNKRDFALKYRRDKDFPFVMELSKLDDLKSLPREEILTKYDSYERYESTINRLDKYELIKQWLKDRTKRLQMARDFIREEDPKFEFRNKIENEDDN